MNGNGKSRRRQWLVAILASLLVHAGFGGIALLTPERPQRSPNLPVEFEVVEVERRPEPEPVPEPEPEPEPEPAPPPPPRRMARAEPPPRPDPPQPAPPPPPNQPPPPEAESEQKPTPIRIGVSLSSTTEAGEMPVATGNSLYGKTDEVAQDPAEIRPYAPTQTEKAPFVPESRLSRPPLPRRGSCPSSPDDYTEAARREGIEGTVILRVIIDENGRPDEIRVVKSLGYGLDEVAVRLMRNCPFEPGLGPDGTPVRTEIRYHFRFRLDDW